jgi:electron transport complex protein RnfG
MSKASFPIRPALALAGIGLTAAVLLAGLNELTRDPIQQARDDRATAALQQVLAPERYDNRISQDVTTLRIDGLDEPARVYRARKNGQPSAAVIDMTTPKGYSGDIRLLIAVTPAAEVISVRAVEHRETPGLGDRIERRRSDWIEQFSGRSLGDPARGEWASDQRGGAFDTLTSATLTSTAVIDAIARSLASFERAGEAIWADRAEPGEL